MSRTVSVANFGMSGMNNSIIMRRDINQRQNYYEKNGVNVPMN